LFLENKIGIDQPPGTLTLVSLVEKIPFFMTVIVLYRKARVGWQMMAAGALDGF
jgi:hypothetical protein